MSKPFLLNLIDTFIAATQRDRLTDGTTFHWDWIKRITGLDKSHDTGYSLLGTWVKKENQLSWHRPGLYFVYAYEYVNLPKPDGSDRRVRAHLVSIFDLDCEGIAHLLHSSTYEKGDYAVHCWSVIDGWLLAHTKPKPLPIIEEDRSVGKEAPPEIITVNSAMPGTAGAAIALSVSPQDNLKDEKSTELLKQMPLRDLLIRYAIEAQASRRVRSLPLEQVDISQVVTKSFDWGTEYLFDVFRLDLSRELGVDWSLLPVIKLQGNWIDFYFEENLA